MTRKDKGREKEETEMGREKEKDKKEEQWGEKGRERGN